MKKSIIVALFLTLIVQFSVSAQSGIDTFMVQVDGLGCPFCAYGLEKKFKELKGIKNIKIAIATGGFSFGYPAEKALTMQTVKSQVEKAGYTPVTLKIIRADGKEELSETEK